MKNDLRDMIKDGMLIKYRFGGVNDVDTFYLYKLYDAELKPENLDESLDIMEVFERTETGYDSIWKREEEKFYCFTEDVIGRKNYLMRDIGKNIVFTVYNRRLWGNEYKHLFTQFEYDELVSNGIIKDVFTKEVIND